MFELESSWTRAQKKETLQKFNVGITGLKGWVDTQSRRIYMYIALVRASILQCEPHWDKSNGYSILEAVINGWKNEENNYIERVIVEEKKMVNIYCPSLNFFFLDNIILQLLIIVENNFDITVI